MFSCVFVEAAISHLFINMNLSTVIIANFYNPPVSHLLSLTGTWMLSSRRRSVYVPFLKIVEILCSSNPEPHSRFK